jgi:integrase
MPRKRELDQYVTSFVDRHGKERFRFRHQGLDFYLKPPGTKDYKKQYEAALRGQVPAKERCVPQSVGDLLSRFYTSAQFNKGGADWQKTVRMALEPFREEFANDLVRNFEFDHIEVILAKRAKQTIGANGRKRGGEFSAARLHEQLKRVFKYAVRLRWITTNPADEAELPVTPVTTGFHSWTEDEIAQFQARHPVGSKARLAMEIALWTGLRRGDIAKLGPANLANGRISIQAGKTGKTVNVVAVAPLVEAIAAAPTGPETFLVTDSGKPFAVAGFGNWFRDRCNEAGLKHCTIHGLRKALTRRAAEWGASQAQLKAIGQWSQDAEVAVYTHAADQARLADSAIQMVIERATESNQRLLVRQTEGVL